MNLPRPYARLLLAVAAGLTIAAVALALIWCCVEPAPLSVDPATRW